MKKSLLLLLAFAISLGVMAQKKTINPNINLKTEKLQPMVLPLDDADLVGSPVLNHKSRASQPGFTARKDVEIIDLGNAANAYGFYNGTRTCLWAEPNINSVFFIHRGGGPGNPVTSGNQLCYDYSTDGGATFTKNNGAIYNPATALGFNNARYPQGVLYNPVGNTTPTNAKFVYHAATTAGSGWLPNVYGTGDFTGATASRQVFPTLPNGTTQNVSDAMHCTTLGEVWVVDNANLNGNEYNDSLTIRRGVYNSGTNRFDFTQTFLDHVTLGGSWFEDNEKCFNADNKIAFSEDGLHGWILTLSLVDTTGLIDYEENPTQIAYQHAGYLPVLYKTVNGGNTWTGPIQVNLHKIKNLYHNFPTQQFLQYDLWVDPNGVSPEFVDTLRMFGGFRTAFTADLAVDMDGNPHISTIVTWAEPKDFFSTPLTPFSVRSGAGMIASCHIWSPDGGQNWLANILDYPLNFRGTFGDISEDNNSCAMINFDGDMVFFSWLDTDTLIYPNVENSNPDLRVAGFNLLTNKVTAPVNATTGTDADGIAFMGKSSYYVFEDNGTYELPLVYQEMGSTDVDPVVYKYVKGVTYADADFTNCGDFGIKMTSVASSSATVGDGTATATPIYPYGTYNYAWSGGGNTASITNLLPGWYYVTITHSNGCQVTDSVEVLLDPNVKVNKPVENVKNLSIRPNPTKDNVTVNCDVENNTAFKVIVTNTNGQVMYTESMNSFVGNYNRSIDMSGFAKGVYMLQIITDNKVINKKVVRY